MKTQLIPQTTRSSLLETAANSPRRIASLAAGVTLMSAMVVHAQSDNFWTGATNSDWNEPTNWSSGTVPSGATGPSGEHAVVNTITPNIAAITADIAATPVDIFVGRGVDSLGQVNHSAGNASTGGANWMFVGHSGGDGTYNLADIGGSGGTFTGLGMGTGNLNVGGRLYIAGFQGSGSTGLINVNTEGTLSIGTELQVGTNESVGVFNLDSGAVTTGGWTEIGQGGGSTGTLNISGGSITKGGDGNFTVGNNGGIGTANQTGGAINVNSGEFFVGNNTATGVYNLDGGSVTVEDNWAVIGRDSGTGTLTMTDGSFIKNGGGNLAIGDSSGTGTVNQTGGDIMVNSGQFFVGNGNATGAYNLDGGSVSVDSWVAIGRDNGSGTVEMTGGTFTQTGDGTNFIVGASGPGVMNQSGGLVDVQGGITWIGETNSTTGELSLSGTAEFNTSVFSLGVNAGTTGTLNLGGGIVRTSQFVGGDGATSINFNGTQIIATADQAAFVSNIGTATVDAGGLLLDTNGFSLATSQVFGGTGDIVKTGEGSLDLSGDSTITGAITVSAGTLFVNGALGATSGTTVNATATIGGSGTLGGLATINGTVAPGNSVGTLTADDMTIAASGVYLAELDGNGVNDQLDISGSLVIDGMIQILLNYTPAGGDSFDLANFATFSGDPTFDFSSAPLEPGLSWDTSSFATNGAISVIPEPGVALLGALGLGGLALRRRRH